MGTVAKLNKYRAFRKKIWLEKHLFLLQSHIKDFIKANFRVGFSEISEFYQDLHRSNCEESWDYVDLRDLVHTAMEEHFCENLYESLKGQSWFKAGLISKEEAVEFCLSMYIVGTQTSNSGS